LRAVGIRCEMYPESAKIKKQMQYADKNNIPFVLMAGEEELKSGIFSLKNMKTGEQQKLSAEQLEDYFIKS
jgi:histidyl-tRNA synthetase